MSTPSKTISPPIYQWVATIVIGLVGLLASLAIFIEVIMAQPIIILAICTGRIAIRASSERSKKRSDWQRSLKGEVLILSILSLLSSAFAFMGGTYIVPHGEVGWPHISIFLSFILFIIVMFPSYSLGEEEYPNIKIN
ncbi:MAG: hypothetical protein OXR68_01060 [Alphaproteobacteria bacterium]|nr:hypothetical protein [Alphaproteobacteria bacterium]MDD9919200.1 hypothetical protein [Alphaproteobacteria bacterium]